MTGVRLAFEDADVRVGLLALEAAAGNLEPALDEIGARLESETIGRFESETDPAGARWTPSVRALGEGGQTLTDKGLLRGSITRVVGGGAVFVGTNLVYGAIHQFGSAEDGSPPGGIPPRPFLGVDATTGDILAGIVRDHLAGAA